MWKCPKCNREFAKNNQQHYCGEKPKTIDEYIASCDPEIQPYLSLVRNTIHEVVPEAEERITWSMPTFWEKENIIYFACQKKHIGIYARGDAITYFSDQLDQLNLKYNKGTIQIPFSKEMPLDFIREITKWCHKEATKDRSFKFEAVIEAVPDKGGAFVRVPIDIKAEFGKGRLKVHAEFDGVPYDGSIVNMGVKNGNDSVCYIIGVRKDIQKAIGKFAGDSIQVRIIPV